MRTKQQKAADAKKIEAEVNSRMSHFKVGYDAAWNQVKALPEFKSIFAAMEADRKEAQVNAQRPSAAPAASPAAQRRAAMQVATNSHMANTGCTYTEAWNVVKQLPQFATGKAAVV
jgi:hypothetical protein